MKNILSPNPSLNNSSLELFFTSSINNKVAEIAKQAVNNLFLLAMRNNLTWIDPYITANNNESIDFQWWEKGKYFALSIHSDKSIHFVRAYGPKDPSKKWESNTLRRIKLGQSPSRKELLAIWKWLFVD